VQRHLSTGVSTLVALMAAHRLAARGDETASASSREEIAQIDAYLAYLHEDIEVREAVAPHRDAQWLRAPCAQAPGNLPTRPAPDDGCRIERSRCGPVADSPNYR
jgi:hypothetical protein